MDPPGRSFAQVFRQVCRHAVNAGRNRIHMDRIFIVTIPGEVARPGSLQPSYIYSLICDQVKMKVTDTAEFCLAFHLRLTYPHVRKTFNSIGGGSSLNPDGNSFQDPGKHRRYNQVARGHAMRGHLIYFFPWPGWKGERVEI